MASFDLPIITVLAIAGKIVRLRYSRHGTVIIGTRVLHARHPGNLVVRVIHIYPIQRVFASSYSYS